MKFIVNGSAQTNGWRIAGVEQIGCNETSCQKIFMWYYSSMNIEQSTVNELRVKIFKALADETRLAIIKLLHQSDKDQSCGDVGTQCEASKSNASYHFRTLREAGLIKVRKDAQTKLVSLNRETFETYLPGFLDTL